MTSISYEDIYSRFLSKVEAYDLTELNDEEYSYSMMGDWLKSVKSNPRVRGLFSSITMDNENSKIDFEMKTPQDEDSDTDFIIDVFAIGMAWKWCEPKYKSLINTSQMFGGKEEKFYSQSNHMAELKNMYDTGMSDLYTTIRDYGYMNNSYINED